MSANFTPDMAGYSGIKPFRFWCQKVLPLVYDDSLSYYELLCKVVDYLNHTIEDLSATETNVDNLHDAYEELEGYVNTYFDNLDVQEEVDNKLDRMAQDGTISGLLAPYLAEFNSRLNDQDTEIAQRLDTQDDKLEVLEGRMDKFASLPAGSTSGNAELLDIRVGANGVTYNSAGVAVRTQFDDANDKIDRLNETVYGETAVSFNYTSGYFIRSNGVKTQGEDYGYSDPIAVKAGDIVDFYGKGYSTNIAMISTCDSSGNNIVPKVICPDNVLREYFYAVESDGYIIVSFNKTNDFWLKITKADGLERRILGNERIIFAYTKNSYIAVSGTIQTTNGFARSQAIKVYMGDIIDFYARGYLTNVAMISTCNSDGTSNISVKVGSIDNVNRHYKYTCHNEGYIVVSFDYRYDFELTIIRASAVEGQLRLTNAVSISLFESIGVVGDSFASGTLYYGGSYHDNYHVAWPNIMCRKLGVTPHVYAAGGLTTRSFLTNTSRGMSYLLSESADNLYFLALGINDAYSLGSGYLGSITDITSHSSYADYGDTFYGNYGRIIEMIKEHAPNAKIVISCIANNSGVYVAFNEAIKNIARHYGIPYIVQTDDWYFTSWLYNYQQGSHPIAINYACMANAFERLLSKCVAENEPYFRNYYNY